MKESIQFDFHFDDLPEGICVITDNEKEEILFVNQALLRMYKCRSREEFLSITGGTLRGMVEISDYRPLSEVEHSGAHPLGDDRFYVSFNCRTRDGHFRRMEGVLSRSVRQGMGSVWVLSVVPSKTISSLSYRDALTGLLSLPVFLKKALGTAKKDEEEGIFGAHYPMYLNLTNFKFYNATHGREAGNQLLQKIAEALKRYFSGDLMCHQESDSFLLLGSRDRVPDGLEAMILEIERYIDDPSIRLKSGICDFGRKIPPVSLLRNAFDLAKIACDSIKSDASRSWTFYEDSMGSMLENRAYVLRHFDRALLNGYIKIYFQPVVRTLTGKLCGMEALARWEDPDKGLLTPNVFVPVLESARIIYKLDRYILEAAARFLAERRANGLPVVPVSVNLSRVDFEVSKPLAMVEEVVKRYRLPRHLIRIEITESALVKSEKVLKEAIPAFRKAGYECWLDDFGSQYSSLNVLHDFYLDELKIDMAFLRHFNERSRKIIASIVVMAKTLGIHTLAEGAETEEQVEFLKSVGCEKIQGFYYSSPRPWAGVEDMLRMRHMDMETPEEEILMNKLGLVNVVTEEQVALYLGRGNDLTLLYQNEAHEKNILGASAHTIDDLNGCFADPHYPLREKFFSFVQRLLLHRERQSMTFADNGSYYQVTGQIIAGDESLYVGETSVYSLMPDNRMKTAEDLDSLLRNTLALCDDISLYYPKTGKLKVLETVNPYAKPGEIISAEKAFHDFAEQKVYPEDRGRFFAFIRLDNLYRLGNEANGYAPCGMFRVKEENGNYAWKELQAYILYRTEEKNILLILKDASIERTWDRQALLEIFVHSFGIKENSRQETWRKKADVFNVFREKAHIKWFVKDKNRRFVTASRAFLDYYDLSLSEIQGRTDEDMKWHVDNIPFRKIEEDVLAHGMTARHVIGTCLVKGQLRTIAATKFPVYRGNEIIGLAGYFHDMSEEKELGKEEREISMRDRETGLASYRGMMAAALRYEDNFRQRGEGYMAVLMSIPALTDVERAYGRAVYLRLLQQIVHILSVVSPVSGSLSHISQAAFILLVKTTDRADMERRLQKAADDIHAVTEVDGVPVTLYMDYALVVSGESSTIDSLLQLLGARMIRAEQEQTMENLALGDRISFDMKKFDQSEEQIVISDPNTYEILYVNKAMLNNCGLPDDYNWHGKKCYEVWGDGKGPCSFCPIPRLSNDRFASWVFHNPRSGMNFLMKDTLVNWKGKAVRFNMAFSLQTFLAHYLHENEIIYREVQANDIIAAGLAEKNPEKGIQKMMERLAPFLKAERIIILEESGAELRCTYEWKREDLPSMKEELAHVVIDNIRPFYDYLFKREIVLNNDALQFSKDLGMKKIYVKGIKRLVAGALTLHGRKLGFIEIVNPAPERCDGGGMLLSTLTKIFTILLRNRDMMKEMYTLGHTDELTGAGNLRAFEEWAKAIPDGTRVSFFYCDIDNLKKINDTEGHHMGNEAIKNTTGAIASQVGLNHTFRLGGDEFLAVETDLDEEETALLAEAIRQGFRERKVAVSLGSATFTAPFPPMEEILTVIDGKMYENKREREG